jgi:hypothetical protein
MRDKLSEYIDGMLSQEEASAVKEHLDRCPDCMEEYEEMVKIIGHMNQMERLETPESFVKKIHDRIEEPSSFQRLVKGLFFPIKIKVPLELAGVAAATLLVIYIVGIREKQHVYELAYVQRSQPLAVLQEQEVEMGAEVDEAATLIEKAQPALELKDEKMEKKEKREEAEEAISLSKKELPALAPQERMMERRAKVEETVPHSKMAKPEGERGLEAKKDSPEKATPREENLQNLITALGGKIIESEYNEATQVLESLIIEIPAENYHKLIQTLEERGEIQKPYPAIKEKDQETLQIRLILQQ